MTGSSPLPPNAADDNMAATAAAAVHDTAVHDAAAGPDVDLDQIVMEALQAETDAGVGDNNNNASAGSPPNVLSPPVAAAAAAATAASTPQVIVTSTCTSSSTPQLEEIGFASAYIQKLAPVRIQGQPDSAMPLSRESKSAPLMRYRSATLGDSGTSTVRSSSAGEGTKGSKRSEARWGRRPSPSTSRMSSEAEEDATNVDHESSTALGQTIPLSRSRSAPSANVIGSKAGAIASTRTGRRPPKPGKSGWRHFGRQSPSVSQVAEVATKDCSPSWDKDDERQVYIDAGFSERLSSSDEFEEEEEDDIGDGIHYDQSTSRQNGYPLHRVASAPIQSFPSAPLSPHSPLSGEDSFSFHDEDDLIHSNPYSPQTPRSFDTGSPIARSRSMSSSSDNSSLDSDLMVGFEEDVKMERLARQLAVPPHKRRRGRGRTFFGSPRLSSRGRSSGKGSHLEHLVEEDIVEAELTKLTTDAEEDTKNISRKMSDLDLEERHHGGTGDVEGDVEVIPTGAVAVRVATFRSEKPEMTTPSAPAAYADIEMGNGSTVVSREETKAISTNDEERQADDESEEIGTDEQPTILPHTSSIQMSSSVEFISYDPEAPLSPPPEREACCPTPLVSNMRRGTTTRKDPSPFDLSGDKVDDNNLPPAMPTVGTASFNNKRPTAGAQAVVAPAATPHQWQRRPISSAPSVVSVAETKSTVLSMLTVITKDMFDVRVLFYLSIFSIIGSILRVFTGRAFGLDCDLAGLVDDVFSNGFQKICVTATGITEQRGGALFIDLPANMIGSTMMGAMTSGVKGWPSVPWLKADHPLQQDRALNVAIRTGLFGSLTSFASWNSQMVIMMDGSGIPLGSQILPALFGYMIGLQASIACFLFGRKANVWINLYVNPHVCVEMGGYGRHGTVSRGGIIGLFGDRSGRPRRRTRTMVSRRPRKHRRGSEISTDVPGDIAIPAGHGDDHNSQMAYKRRKRGRRSGKRELPGLKEHGGDPIPPRIIVLPTIGGADSEDLGCYLLGMLFSWKIFPVLLVGVLFSLFVVSDVRWDVSFYRILWLSCCFTPIGAVFRWRLSLLNSHWKSFPLGTFIANILGSTVAILAVAIEARLLRSESSSLISVQIAAAIKIGFAGSLSTVSSFVKEVVDITEDILLGYMVTNMLGSLSPYAVSLASLSTLQSFGRNNLAT
eukprot:CAMPEP_0181056298 /NCGR_PEP_ID=MMETSP1070-20121207/19655_1 /TAXON_ID=265543 /ORGANISM="Minutocellus polymorphus, Strain NH13" /LENGTH=1175 /DNA_ID=CAMNT_0023135661 /DNA_START=57 /DNA_END=3585 /DNA_ORIENTATION=+